MLSYLLRQLIRSFGIFFRTIRAFFTRKLAGAGAYIRRVTNFSRQATKVANASFQGAAAAMKKPTKREDYIETERLFVSKSFLVMLAVGLLLLILAGYFILWPLLLSRFFTAHFYQEDKRVEDWSGKVVVYYDEEKEIPRYSGRLKEGVLQGRGSQYDEAGLLIYEGDFADGVRSGTGTLYDAGVLTYEGDFAYGLRHGNGTDYSATGDVAYRGAFVEDVREGMGTAYYPDGERAYEGAFAAGLYDGTGTQYGEDGQIRYKGSFAEGLYNGSGTLYLPDGDQIQAEFVDGHTDGTIRWYQEGKLWYDGSADDLTPDGFGTIYAENGKVIYAGEMDRGTLDGAWLLGLTAEDLRAAFGEAALEESDGARGFRVRNGELGLTALCSYQTEEEEARPYQLWLAPGETASPRSCCPGRTGRRPPAGRRRTGTPPRRRRPFLTACPPDRPAAAGGISGTPTEICIPAPSSAGAGAARRRRSSGAVCRASPISGRSLWWTRRQRGRSRPRSVWTS